MSDILTVKDLIKHLSKMDQKLPVGRVGHFGKFYAMDKYDFRKTFVDPTLAQQHNTGNNVTGYVLNIDPPDIGENPD